jgi:hypothetical protein
MSTDLRLEGVLEGIGGDILIEQNMVMENISIDFSISANVYEDISIGVAFSGVDYWGCYMIFSLTRPNVYNYKDIHIGFEIELGESSTDIPIVFCLVRSSVDYIAYIIQKTYSVMTELNGNTDLEIFDWNVYPNQTWFIEVVQEQLFLYGTEEDLINLSNLVATGVVDPDTLSGVLYKTDEYGEPSDVPMDFYYKDWKFHFTLSAILPDVRHFRLKPFSDIEEIQHPVYNNSNISLSRGQAEVNLHTYTVLPRDLELAIHVPEMDIGDVVDFTSTRRNKSQKSQILTQTISGAINDNGEASLTNKITVANYMELFRR